MSSPFIKIRAFGKEYPFPSLLVYDSRVLTSAFSGQFKEQDTIDLDLEARFQPAFEYIYNSLLGQPYDVNPLTLLNAIILADYLDIPIIIHQISQIIARGNVPLDLLLNNYNLYKYLDPIKLTVAALVINHGPNYENFPKWVQEVFREFQTTSISNINPNSPYMLIKFIPFEQYQNMEIYQVLKPNFARICQKSFWSTLINPQDIPAIIQSGNNIGGFFDKNGKLQYVTCPDSRYPYIQIIEDEKYGTVPCCTRSIKYKPKESDLWDILAQKKVMRAEGDFLVFIDPIYNRDYVSVPTTAVISIPQLNAILIP